MKETLTASKVFASMAGACSIVAESNPSSLLTRDVVFEMVQQHFSGAFQILPGIIQGTLASTATWGSVKTFYRQGCSRPYERFPEQRESTSVLLYFG